MMKILGVDKDISYDLTLLNEENIATDMEVKMYESVMLEQDEINQRLSNTRYKYTFTIGTTATIKEELRDIVDDISIITGGCTVFKGKGYWSINGEHMEDMYQEAAEESSYSVVVTVTPEMNKDFYHQAQEIFFRYLYNENPLHSKATWIDCNVETVQAKHFCLDHLAKERGAA
jgi:hypothetical protein